MKDGALEAELLHLGEEARRIRKGRGRGRKRWPDDFRRKLLAVLDKGVRPKEIFEATGLRQWTWQEWRKGLAGFSELKVVSARRTPTVSLIRLRTAQGSELSLSLPELKLLLGEGLI